MHRVGSVLSFCNRQNRFRTTLRCRGVQLCRYKSGKTDDPHFEKQNIKDLYNRWLNNPSSVDNVWNSFFLSVSQGRRSSYRESNDAGTIYESPQRRHYHVRYGAGASVESRAIVDNMLILEMIRGYQTHGYHLCSLDPLGVNGSTERLPHVIPEDIPYEHVKDELVELVKYVKVEINNDQVFNLPSNTFIGGNKTSLPLKEIIKRLEDTYCSRFGIEFGHINSVSQCNWLKKKFEPPGSTKVGKDLRRLALARLIRASGLELFANKKFPSGKRFGAEGAEMAIPCMKQIIDRSTELGTECIVIAMAHRGRINIIANVCRKSLEQVYAQFQNLDVKEPDEGDMKYHLGLCMDRLNKVTNKNIRLILIANPSHLECSASVMHGRARAEQFYRNDKLGKKVLPICVHGDAAVSGQGIVYELEQMSDLPSFTTNGTIHIIINNQLGFTTMPLDGRSSPFPSEIAKISNAPIIHVNGDDPDAVIYAANVAAEWRATFRRNIYLDILMYRRQGHSENDEPTFTQPIMYSRIHKMKPVVDIYSDKLIGEGIVNAKEVDDVRQKYEKLSEAAFEASKKETYFNTVDWKDNPWSPLPGSDKQEIPATGIPEDILLHIGKIHSSPPATDFVLHKGLERVLKGRTDMLNAKTIDWSLGEAMAIGSILKEGMHVRFVGQDTGRGTFAHRHYVLHHQTVENKEYIPLNHLYENQAPFFPINSPLSEYAVLGYEFGYSQARPNVLCVWEAQFGDFVDTAQCILDCFICPGEGKWQKQSGLMINLPHGLEGMGPDHSSARPERFLLMCVDDPNNIPTGNDAAFRQLKECNWIVAQVTTPANLFHIMRRQVHMPFRKVLIHFFPKSLLRLPAARSHLDECKEGTSFQRVIPDRANPSGVKKVVFSCGKVYYDFQKARKKNKLENEIALIRIEQVYPFPYDLITAEIAKYPNATFCFGQEEHMNQGYQTFVIPRLQKLLPGKEVKLLSRAPASAGAVGFPKTHQRQLDKLLQDFINA